MTDQTTRSVLTNAPIPAPGSPAPQLSQAPEGAVLRDPASIDAALKALADQQPETPLRFASAEPESAPEPERLKAEDLQPIVEPKVTAKPSAGFALPTVRPGGAPAWAKLPPDITFPRGRTLFFLRFRASLTNTPARGIPSDDLVEKDANGVLQPVLFRQCIVWALSVGDKKMAMGRAMSDVIRFNDELVKSSIRAIDGELVTGADGSLDVWWDEVGEKVRGLIQRTYNQIHNLRPEEMDFFLEHCVEGRSGV